MPVNGSILTRARPLSGRPKRVISPHLAVASCMKPCETYVDTSIEKTGRAGVDTGVLSLFPFQTPTASAYAPSFRPASLGGAM